MKLMLILFTATCCWVLYRLAQRLLAVYRQYPHVQKLPGPPIQNIILGHTTDMTVKPEGMPELSRQRYELYGGIFRLWILGYPFVMISKAEYVESFFTAKPLAVKSPVYSFLHSWLGLGLLTSSGPVWQQRRKLITPAFHFAVLNDFSKIFVKNTLTLIQKLREFGDGTSVDVFMMMHLVALDNICESAMGIQIDALKNPKTEYIRAIEGASYKIMERISRPWYWNDIIFFMIPAGRTLTRYLNTIFQLTNKAITNGKNQRAFRKKANEDIKYEEVEGRKKMAFLDLLLETSESHSVPLSDEDLRDEVNTFMFEGHDTTAAAMSFTLYLLGLHPEIQVKCFEELDGIFQGSDRRPTVEDFQNMKYLEQVIKETLRLFPSVPLISREVTEDVRLGSYTIPKGVILGLNLYNLHRDPKVFPDPEKFNPDRFTSDNCSTMHPYAYVPFAAGSRNCIGQKFAMLEEKVVLSYILRNFTLESVYKMEELKVLFSLIIRSQKSLDVKFKSRKTCQT